MAAHLSLASRSFAPKRTCQKTRIWLWSFFFIGIKDHWNWSSLPEKQEEKWIIHRKFLWIFLYFSYMYIQYLILHSISLKNWKQSGVIHYKFKVIYQKKLPPRSHQMFTHFIKNCTNYDHFKSRFFYYKDRK